VWRTEDDKPLHPHTNYNVGGNTTFYGAALFRFREEDFGEVQHHDGTSPAWPISYEDLRPYYLEAESLYRVHGQRGEDPTEPPADAPYPHPAISHEPRIQQLSDGLAASGLRPFHTPLGIMLDEAAPHKSKRNRCETCEGYPCLVQAKADAEVLCVAPALEQNNVTLLTNAKALVLETSACGRELTRIQVEHNGIKETYSADIVTEQEHLSNVFGTHLVITSLRATAGTWNRVASVPSASLGTSDAFGGPGK
jgi:choline dehydrogenase-like flavoprotein